MMSVTDFKTLAHMEKETRRGKISTIDKTRYTSVHHAFWFLLLHWS